MDTFKNSVFVFMIGSVFLSHIHIMTWENKEVVQQTYETQIKKISFNESEQQLVQTEESIQDKKRVAKNRQRMSAGKIALMVVGVLLGAAIIGLLLGGVIIPFIGFLIS